MSGYLTRESAFNHAKFLSAPGLAWQGALKEANIKLDLLIESDMLLMIEKGFRGGKNHSIF